MAKSHNPRRIKRHRNYTAEEAAEALDVHVQTVRSWEAAGLRILKDSVPYLILGADLRGFLERRRAKREPLGPNRFYCTRCRGSTEAAGGFAYFVPKNDRQGRLVALCEGCESPVNRFVSTARLPSVAPDLDVSLEGGAESLTDSAPLPSKTHSEAQR